MTKPTTQLVTVANVPSPNRARIASVPRLNPTTNPHKGSSSKKNRHPPNANARPINTARIPTRSCTPIPPVPRPMCPRTMIATRRSGGRPRLPSGVTSVRSPLLTWAVDPIRDVAECVERGDRVRPHPDIQPTHDIPACVTLTGRPPSEELAVVERGRDRPDMVDTGCVDDIDDHARDRRARLTVQ